MRYLSLLFVVFCMWWTWTEMEAPALVDETTHANIQDDLKRVITESILEHQPNASDIRFDRFWTQTLKETQMKASFSYSFDDGQAADQNARVGVDGYAILNRVQDNASEYDVWSLDELRLMNNHLDFKEGITIRAAKGPEDVTSEESSTPPTQPEDPKSNHE